MTLQSRILGGLYGSLVGDALGVPVEFCSRTSRVADPVTGLRGYGVHNQPAGTWSDDGSLLLCSTESLVEKGFDTQDMGLRFVQWYDSGLWTAHGQVFDIGNATASALSRIASGIPAKQAGGTSHMDNGNGSLMRILPVSLSAIHQPESVLVDQLARASTLTHGHPRSQMACVFHGLVVRALMEGDPPQKALTQAQDGFNRIYADSPELGVFHRVLNRSLSEFPVIEIPSGGYVIETLTASLWCLLTTSSFAECVLKAVNLGSDTDTTGCVAGGLAGVLYGVESIPPEWQSALPRQNDLRDLFERFLAKYVP